jgi:hypothetical protein
LRGCATRRERGALIPMTNDARARPVVKLPSPPVASLPLSQSLPATGFLLPSPVSRLPSTVCR